MESCAGGEAAACVEEGLGINDAKFVPTESYGAIDNNGKGVSRKAFPSTYATHDEMPLSSLPPLPKRGSTYRTEPCIGLLIVTLTCALTVTASVCSADWRLKRYWVALLLVCVWCGVACICALYLVFAAPDEILRTRATCYPIPRKVADKLQAGGDDLYELQNVKGPRNSLTHATYCVRCLVWRPPGRSTHGDPHHCRVCQRCFVGFDHHCSVFGRCVTQGKLPAFYLLIVMVPVGFLTALTPAILTSPIA